MLSHTHTCSHIILGRRRCLRWLCFEECYLRRPQPCCHILSFVEWVAWTLVMATFVEEPNEFNGFSLLAKCFSIHEAKIIIIISRNKHWIPTCKSCVGWPQTTTALAKWVTPCSMSPLEMRASPAWISCRKNLKIKTNITMVMS